MKVQAATCRFCGAPLNHTVLDLGEQPLANSFLTEADLQRPEPRYPLRICVCATPVSDDDSAMMAPSTGSPLATTTPRTPWSATRVVEK